MVDYERKSMGERICENKGLYIPQDNSKRQASRDRQMQRKLKNLKVNKMQTSLISIAVVVAIVLLAFALVNLFSKPKITINDKTNFEEIDLSKYSAQVLAMYNRDGQAELFEKEMSRIQTAVGKYLMTNMTMEEESLQSVMEEISKELESDNWNNILSNRSTYYLGTYSLDENANVKFKFKSKDIEPSWINDENVSKYIILN